MPRQPDAILKALQLQARHAFGVDDLAQVLGVSESAVKNHVLPYCRTFKVGDRRLVSRDALMEYIRNQEAAEVRNGDVERAQIREALGLSQGYIGTKRYP